MFSPLGKRILIKPHEEDKSAGGIYLPEVARQSQVGTVTATGKEIVSPIVGQVVLFEKDCGTELKVNGQKQLLLHPKDILAIIE